MNPIDLPTTCFLCGGTMLPKYELKDGKIMYCSTCHLGQLAPLPDEADLARIYASREYFENQEGVGYADYDAHTAEFARTFQAKIDKLLRCGPVRDLLEIGCGPGHFLAEARRAGIARAVGVDLNRWAVEEARRNDLEVYEGSVEAVPIEQRFDAVVMLDVLEHFMDPMAILSGASKRLRPGGRLFVMTPNIRSLLARASRERWVSLKNPEHVYYYSPRSIRLLLRRCGYEPLSVRGTGQYATVAFLLSRLGLLLPRSTAVLQRAARLLGLEDHVVFATNGSLDVIAKVAGDPARDR